MLDIFLITNNIRFLISNLSGFFPKMAENIFRMISTTFEQVFQNNTRKHGWDEKRCILFSYINNNLSKPKKINYININ